MKNLHTLNLLPVLALASFFEKIIGSTSLRPVLTGPDLAFIRSRVAFRCFLPDSSPPVTYELIKDGAVLFATATDDQDDQPAPFFLKVAASSEGSYQCRATAGGSTGVSNSIQLGVVNPPSDTRIVSNPFPAVMYEGSVLVLSCNVSKGSHLFYTWFFNRRELTSSNSPHLQLQLIGNQLVVEKVTPEHAGNYYCMAWSQVQDIRRFSSSSDLQVTVKVYISKPSISFSVFKGGDSYFANVSCWSTRGTPPVNISLSIDSRVQGSVTASDSLTAWFSVNIVPGLDMGKAQCLVKTEVQELKSEPLTLEVVPVGGEMRVEVEYLYTADSQVIAAALSCEVNRGTFPHITWLFNDSVLPSETHQDSHIQPVLTHYALTRNSQTLLLAKLGPEESGYYRCRARNDYDDSGPWVESAAVVVRVAEFFMDTKELLSIIFCSFLLLALIVGASIVYHILNQRQALTHISTSSFDELTLSAPTALSGHRDADVSSNDAHVQNQTIEITV